MPGWLIVGLKEVRDHSRDNRALGVAALYALMGPAVVFLVSRSSAVEKGGPRLLVALMSVFALVSAFTSGMHVALDTAAGERERGSLVPLLLNPVSRLHLVVGKWAGVSAFSLVGLALTLVGFTLAFEWGGVEPPGDLIVPVLVWIVCGLMPLALFGAALDLFAAASCKTLKEAQGRLSFVMFAPMMVGMFLVFFPGRLGPWSFAVPVIGQQALIGAGLRGQPISPLHAGLVGVTTMAAALLIVLATARSFSRNEIAAG
jgi:sodium transport system permease protein